MACERRASLSCVSCRVRRPIWQHVGYLARACALGRLTRHETPLRLARPSQATKISKPNRFAYPFRSRPRGVCGSPILNLRPAKTPSYRDTANLGLGVTPRPLPISPPCVFAGNPIFKLRTVPEAPLRQRVASREPAKEHVALLGRERTLQVPFAS